MKNDKTQCVIILGMHRAGTSLVANIFHEWGVNLGDDLMEGDVANPKGFFENLDFVNLNNTLLEEQEASWNYPIMINSSDERAKELIEKHKSRLWGWKDNRTAFTFKAYEPFLENILFVICKRNKEAVIKSLQRTHIGQFKEEDRNDEYLGILYDKYYAAIENISRDYPRVIVHYEDLVNNKLFDSTLKHF